MWLIAGLGNPGAKYENTPHNLGFMVVDEILRRHGLSWQDARKFNGVMAGGAFEGEKLYFLKPMTFMNLSGNAVRPVADYYKIPSENILVISDEVQLPFGRIRLRREGSHGGQNGLRDIIAKLGTQAFPRLRVGCQPDHQIADLAGYLLTPMGKAKREVAALAVEEAANCVETVISEGVDAAMTKHNKWKADVK